MAANGLDFFVIGAMKAGTTSLHYQLKTHPRIFLPAEKEAPFFAMDELYARGLEWYLEEFFSRARPDQLCGTVSPQYMVDPRVPARIHAAYPRARLVAVLRDPLARLRSHYKMMVRAFGEQRPLAQALSGQYVEAGEYGRVLAGYLEHFERDQLLVFYLRELELDSGAALARLYPFLGLPAPAAPAELERRNTAEGARRRPLARLAANTIHTYLRPVRPLIKKLVPERYTRRVGLWSIMYRSSVADPGRIDTTIPAAAERELARRYLQDLAILEPLVGRAAPWRERLERLADGA